MTGDYYSEDDFYGSRSPGLEAIVVSAKPAVTPPPIVTHIFVSPPSSSRRKRSNRQKTRPTQGDLVLIREMDPNRPDIAQAASQEALNSASESEAEDDEMEDQFSGSEFALPPSRTMLDTRRLAQDALDQSKTFPNSRKPREDSFVDSTRVDPASLHAERRASHTSSTSSVLYSVHSNTSTTSGNDSSTLNVASSQQGSNTNGDAVDSTISPSLRGLAISPRNHPDEKLPVLQTLQPPPSEGAVGSPSQQLPSFRQFDEIVRSVSNEAEVNIFQHRQSVSSTGQSPSSIMRSLSISSPSPASPFSSFHASSPISASSDMSRERDVFLRSENHLTLFGPGPRRPSQVSASGHFPLRSASISTESYATPEGLAPGSLHAPMEGGRQRLLSLDGAMASRHLPPPVGSGISHIPASVTGSFKCEQPGCTAPPFQTQYLLKYVCGRLFTGVC